MAVDPDDKKTVQNALMEITNRTPNEFRARLQGFSQQVQQTQVSGTAIKTFDPPPPPPRVTNSTQSLQAGALTLGNINSTANGSDGIIPVGQGSGNISFATLIKTNTGSGVGFDAGIMEGVLYDTMENFSDELNITGLLSRDLKTGYLNISSYPTYIGLEIDFGTWPNVVNVFVFNVTAAPILCEYTSDGMTPPNFTQSVARIVLSNIVDKGDGTPFVRSKPGDLSLFATNLTGYLFGGGSPQLVPAVYPF